jgi:uncharacterized membrane protein
MWNMSYKYQNMCTEIFTKETPHWLHIKLFKVTAMYVHHTIDLRYLHNLQMDELFST